MRSRKQRIGRQQRLHAHRSRLVYQRLEDRRLLAGDLANPLHNYAMPKDVNGDSSITAVDALIVVNALTQAAEGELVSSNSNPNGNRFLDVNNDGRQSAIDALMVVNGITVSSSFAAVTGGNASMNGFVFNDQNRNGRQDAGEGPFAGLEVALLDGLGNPLVPPATTTTNSQGFYEFTDRQPGLYRVALQPLGSGQEQTYPLFDRFAKAQFVQTALVAGSVDATDLNQDGFVDLVVGNEMDNPLNHQRGSLMVLTNTGGGDTPFTGAAVQSIPLPDGFRIQSVIGSQADLLVSSFGVAGQSNAATNGVFAFTNNGSGSFTPLPSLEIACGSGSDCDGVLDAIAVDATGDGLKEVFAVSQRSNTISIKFGSGGVMHLGPDQVPARPVDLASGGDLNGDGIADVVAAHYSGDLSIMMSGSGMPAPLILDVGTTLSAVEVADIDGDENLDILALDWGDTESRNAMARLHVLYGDGRGQFAPGTPITLGTNRFPSGLAVETSDDLPDLLISNESGSFSLLENLGGRRFSSVENFPVSFDPSQLHKADPSLPDLSTTDRLTPMGVEFIDITGDGVSEAIIANKVGGVAIYQHQFDDYRIRLDGEDQINLDFGVFGIVPSTGMVTGTKFIDSNENGFRESSEAGMGGVTIYADLDGDGQPDVGEPQDVTASDGTYKLTLPAPGTFTIREVVPPGYRQTFPASGEHVVLVDGLTATDNFDFGNVSRITPGIDFGDAPDSYGTTLSLNGANHGITSGLMIGSVIDPEIDGQPSAMADGDDLRGSDDEDGVRLLSPVVPGATVTFEVTATNTTSTNAFLQAFIDFNRDGDFNDLGEQIGTDIPVASGSFSAVVPITVSVPTDAMLGTSYARFRLSQTSGLSSTGSASSGEVEDYELIIETDPVDLDFGDAPDSYRTLLRNDGPRHMLGSGLFLGTRVDSEPDGQPSALANGDDVSSGPSDETGISASATQFEPLSLTAGETATVFVTASQSGGFLDAFIDFNDDGDFLDIGEQIFLSQPLQAGVNTLTFDVPLGATAGETFSRWRISSTGGLLPTGPADDGEVEDHSISIAQPPGVDPHIVFVIDVSGSMAREISGTPVGDVNGDGLQNSALDAALEAFVTLNEQLQSLLIAGEFDSVTVSVVTFAQDSWIVNFPGTMTDSSPPDGNVTGELKATQFVSSLETSFDSALASVDEIFAAVGKNANNLHMFLLSDGRVPDVDTQSLEFIRQYRGANLRAFGIDDRNDANPQALQMIDPDAIIFSDAGDLISYFGSVTKEL